MKIVIAIDSFKGSLSSMQAGESAAAGIKKIYPDADVIIKPIADGGEGTVDALVDGLDGEKIKLDVTGPLGKKVTAEYGIIKGNVAIIEIAAAAGITLISDKERNPLHTTTYGVGEIIVDAIKRNCRKFIIGLGGSVTNDGGVGMLQALGFSMLDEKGEQIPFGAKGLSQLKTIDSQNVIKELAECEFNIACDVTNPLCGEAGCSAVFSPQKGATKEMVVDMDCWLKNFATLSKTYNKNADMNASGAGAAGGLGFAFMTFLNGKLKKGIELVLNEINIEKDIKDSDIVITGEGRLDAQTVMGKAPIGVAKIAKKYDIPVIAFAGCVTDDAVKCNEFGIDAFFSIVNGACSLQDAIDVDNAKRNMKNTVTQVFGLIKQFK